MTTFVDFRYSRSLSMAWDQNSSQSLVEFIRPGRESYLALHVEQLDKPRLLLALSHRNALSIALYLREGMICELEVDGKAVLSTALRAEEIDGIVVALKLGPQSAGLRSLDACCEQQIDLSSILSESLELITPGASVLGRQAGRAAEWAEIFYGRNVPIGPGLQIVMDWHHLNSGLPLISLYMAEQLVKRGYFNLRFLSYSVSTEAAKRSDFVILFGSKVKPEITLHICPPLYTWPVPGTVNVGYFVCESSQPPSALLERLNMMDIILTPSNFSKDCYRQAGVKVPIEVVPHGLDTEFFRPAVRKEPIPGGKRFNFVSVSSHVDRKNFRWLVQAFLEEFRADEDVALLLCMHPEYVATPFNVAMEYEAWENRYFRDSAKVLVMTHNLRREKLRDLYANADCYVLPSCEGFGLTHLEAMSCGTPTVGLDYGGVKDFLRNDNGYLVECGAAYRSVNMDSIAYISEKFYRPKISQLRRVMREIFSNPSQAAQKAKKARSDCETWFSWNKVGDLLSDRLRQAYQDRKPAGYSTSLRLPDLSWALCVHDDKRFARSLPYFQELKEARGDLICFVTRYSSPSDIIKARNTGFLPISWDGNLNTCKTACEKVSGSEWVGLLEPGERLRGDLSALKQFLSSQNPSVAEVQIEVDGEMQTRIIRTGPAREQFETVSYGNLRVSAH